MRKIGFFLLLGCAVMAVTGCTDIVAQPVPKSGAANVSGAVSHSVLSAGYVQDVAREENKAALASARAILARGAVGSRAELGNRKEPKTLRAVSFVRTKQIR